MFLAGFGNLNSIFAVSVDALASLWESFHAVSEGFGLSEAECVEVLSSVGPHVGLDRAEIGTCGQLLFERLDTDENGVVDGLELVATLCLLSAAPVRSRLEMITRLVDFDEHGSLDAAAMALGLRCAVGGAAKLCVPAALPAEDEVDAVAAAIVQAATNTKSSRNVETLVEASLSHPVLESWINYFSDGETDVHPAELELRGRIGPPLGPPEAGWDDTIEPGEEGKKESLSDAAAGREKLKSLRASAGGGRAWTRSEVLRTLCWGRSVWRSAAEMAGRADEFAGLGLWECVDADGRRADLAGHAAWHAAGAAASRQWVDVAARVYPAHLAREVAVSAAEADESKENGLEAAALALPGVDGGGGEDGAAGQAMRGVVRGMRALHSLLLDDWEDSGGRRAATAAGAAPGPKAIRANRVPPPVCASLERVCGWSVLAAPGSVRYTVSGDVVYPAATVVVVRSADGSQRWFQGHTGEISAVDVWAGEMDGPDDGRGLYSEEPSAEVDGSHFRSQYSDEAPSKDTLSGDRAPVQPPQKVIEDSRISSLVASADAGGPFPLVCLWRPETCAPQWSARLPCAGGVSLLRVSPCGRRVLAVCADSSALAVVLERRGDAQLEVVGAVRLLPASVAPQNVAVSDREEERAFPPRAASAEARRGEAAASVFAATRSADPPKPTEGAPLPPDPLLTAPEEGTPAAAAWTSPDSAVVVGVDRVWIVQRDEAGVWRATAAIWGAVGRRAATAAAPHPGMAGAAVVGTADGSLVVFHGRSATLCLAAHAGPVACTATVDSGMISAGLEDARVRLWGPDLQPTRSLDLRPLGMRSPAAHSIDWDVQAHRILYAGRSGDVWELSAADGSSLHLQGPIFRGPAAGVAALSVSPDGSTVATVGDDAMLRLLPADEPEPEDDIDEEDEDDEGDLDQEDGEEGGQSVYGSQTLRSISSVDAPRRQRQRRGQSPSKSRAKSTSTSALGKALRLPAAARAVAWHPGGRFVAIGLGCPEGTERAARLRPGDRTRDPLAGERARRQGELLLVDVETLAVVFARRDARAWICALSWNPAGDRLAAGCADGAAYVYRLGVVDPSGSELPYDADRGLESILAISAPSSKKLDSKPPTSASSSVEDGRTFRKGRSGVARGGLGQGKAEAARSRAVGGVREDWNVALLPQSKCVGHSAAVRFVDWSVSGEMLRTGAAAPDGGEVPLLGTRSAAFPGSVAASWALERAGVAWASVAPASRAGMRSGTDAPAGVVPVGAHVGPLSGGADAAAVAEMESPEAASKEPASARDAGARGVHALRAARSAGGWETLFWEASSGEPSRAAPALRRHAWNTESNPLQWGLRGSWPREGRGPGPVAGVGTAAARKALAEAAAEAAAAAAAAAAEAGAEADATRLERAAESARGPLLAAAAAAAALAHPLPSAIPIEAIERFRDRFVEATAAGAPREQTVAAVADDLGRVRIARFPWDASDRACVVLHHHGAAPTTLQWAPDGSRLWTAGSRDGCIFQYAVEHCEEEEEEEDERVSFGAASHKKDRSVHSKKSASSSKKREEHGAEEDEEEEEEDSLDEELDLDETEERWLSRGDAVRRSGPRRTPGEVTAASNDWAARAGQVDALLAAGFDPERAPARPADSRVWTDAGVVSGSGQDAAALAAELAATDGARRRLVPPPGGRHWRSHWAKPRPNDPGFAAPTRSYELRSARRRNWGAQWATTTDRVRSAVLDAAKEALQEKPSISSGGARDKDRGVEAPKSTKKSDTKARVEEASGPDDWIAADKPQPSLESQAPVLAAEGGAGSSPGRGARLPEEAAIPQARTAQVVTCAAGETLRPERFLGASLQHTRNGVLLLSDLAPDPEADAVAWVAGAAVVVALKRPDGRGWQQRFYRGHGGPVRAIAATWHPERGLPVLASTAAEGAGRQPAVHVWLPPTDFSAAGSASVSRERTNDPLAMPKPARRVAVLLGHKVGVSHVAFRPRPSFESASARGAPTLVASVGMDAHHSIAVHDWRAPHGGRMLVLAPGHVRRTRALAWSRRGEGLAVCGPGHVTFYTLEGRSLARRPGVLGRWAKDDLLSLGWAGPEAVIGTRRGQLVCFAGVQAVAAVDAHDGPVYAMETRDAPDGSTTILSAGADGVLRFWRGALVVDEDGHDGDEARAARWTIEPLRALETAGLPQCVVPAVRCVSWDGTRVAVGTAGSEVYLVDAASGRDVSREALATAGEAPVTQGHFQGEARALAAHPRDPALVATAADDGIVRVLDLNLDMVVASADCDCPVGAVAWHPDGAALAAVLGSPDTGGGTSADNRLRRDGTVVVLDAEEMTVLHEGRDTAVALTAACFSPDGRTLAVGAADGSLYLYDVRAGYELRGVASRLRSPVDVVDFSADSRVVRIVDAAGRCAYLSSGAGDPLAAPAVARPLVFQSHSAPFGYELEGAWPQFPDGNPLQCAARQPAPPASPEDEDETWHPLEGAPSAAAVSAAGGDQAAAAAVARKGMLPPLEAATGGLVVLGDAAGRLRLLPWPAIPSDRPTDHVTPAQTVADLLAAPGALELHANRVAAILGRTNFANAARDPFDLSDAIASGGSNKHDQIIDMEGKMGESSSMVIASLPEHRLGAIVAPITGRGTVGRHNGVPEARSAPGAARAWPVSRVFPGHGSAVGKVVWTCDGRRVVALGRYDRVTSVWRLERQMEALQSLAEPAAPAVPDRRRSAKLETIHLYDLGETPAAADPADLLLPGAGADPAGLVAQGLAVARAGTGGVPALPDPEGLIESTATVDQMQFASASMGSSSLVPPEGDFAAAPVEIRSATGAAAGRARAVRASRLALARRLRARAALTGGVRLVHASGVGAGASARATAVSVGETRSELSGALSVARPWAGSVVAPTEVPRPPLVPPEADLRLEWLHGYTGRAGLRDNVGWTSDGRAVYPAGPTAVILDRLRWDQAWYTAHASAHITALRVAADGATAVTVALGVRPGDPFPRPELHIWDVRTQTTIRRLPRMHRAGIAAVAFGPLPTESQNVHSSVFRDDDLFEDDDEEEGGRQAVEASASTPAQERPSTRLDGMSIPGASGDAPHDSFLLATVGEEEDHVLCVWDVQSGSVVASGPVGAADVAAVSFCAGTGNGGADLAVVGDGFVTFVHVEVGALEMWPGTFGKEAEQTAVSTANVWERALWTGTASGDILEWTNSKVSRCVKAHDGAVLASDSTGDLLVTGGSDGFVRLWGAGPAGGPLGPLGAVSLVRDAVPTSIDPSIRAVAIRRDRARSSILVGTAGSEIYDVTRPGGGGHGRSAVASVSAHGSRADPDRSIVRGGGVGGGGVEMGKPGSFSSGAFGTSRSVEVTDEDAYADLGGGDGRVQRLAAGHCAHETRALAPHPTLGDVALSVGDDATLRLLSCSTRSQVAAVDLPTHAGAAAWSPGGGLLAVGLGARVGPGGAFGRHPRDGAVAILAAHDLAPLWEGREGRAPVTALQFSPEGDALAVGARDGFVRIWRLRLRMPNGALAHPADVGPGPLPSGAVLAAELASVCEGTGSPVIAVDWDAAGRVIQVNDAAGELTFFTVEDGQRVEWPSSVRDLDWHQWTIPMGWATVGAWTSAARSSSAAGAPKATDISAPAESNLGTATAVGVDVLSVHADPLKDLLAVGDSTGRIRLLRWPAAEAGARSLEINAHAGPVASVRFSCDGLRLLSAGKLDGVVAQYRVLRGGMAPEVVLPIGGPGLESTG